MVEEHGLLNTVLANRHEDAPRLMYADWLEEQGDQERAEYLRVQCELARTWFYDNPCQELFARLAKLQKGIDPAWLALVRRCTTPRPPVDVAEIIPELKKHARTTVRLHPRRGTAAVDASKIGGQFLWPAEEPWPECPGHLPAESFVPALQLRKDDVPEIGFKEGTDLFQVLWCADVHPSDEHPSDGRAAPRVYWRERAQVQHQLQYQPDGSRYEPCILYPERVIEYPTPDDFPEVSELLLQSEELQQALRLTQVSQWKSWGPPPDVAALYDWYLSTTQSTKVGGHPNWFYREAYFPHLGRAHAPECSCGAAMEHLLSFSSHEYISDWNRWLAIEDRPTLEGPEEEVEAVMSAPGLMVATGGHYRSTVYLFICRRCKDWPIACQLQGT